jgi:hypothetical protein
MQLDQHREVAQLQTEGPKRADQVARGVVVGSPQEQTQCER